MEKLISFSIAAYNVEATLRECLDSFLVPDSSKIEVLIINDGSTDSTAHIACEYCQKYPELFKLVEKTNGGHGSTINTAISLAKGTYFRPIDGDDWIESKNLPQILEILEKTDSDLILLDYLNFFEKTDGTKRTSFDFLPKNSEFTFAELQNPKAFEFHCVLFKTTLLQENHVAVSENIFYDDAEYALYPLEFVKTISYIPLPLYCYRLGREGQSVSLSSRFKHLDDQIRVIKNIFDFASKNKSDAAKYSYYKDFVRGHIGYFFNLTFERLWFSDPKYQKMKVALLHELEEKDRDLFLYCATDTKIKRLQYKTGYKFDRILSLAKRLVKK